MAGGCIFVAYQVNEKATRVCAFFTVLAVAGFLITGNAWIIIALGADFLIRGFIKPTFSPVSALSGALLRALRTKPQLINAGPKLFAAKMGFVFCAVIAVPAFLQFSFYTLFVSGIFILFASLEAFAGYCAACRIYSLLFIRRESIDYTI